MATRIYTQISGAVGVTLRLWIDPRGPDVERACCSPAAVVAARELCHSRGLPHVTLDLRDVPSVIGAESARAEHCDDCPCRWFFARW